MCINRCEGCFECQGQCSLNLEGSVITWDIISRHCKGTIEEEELIEDVFNDRKGKKELETKFKLNVKEVKIIRNNLLHYS